MLMAQPSWPGWYSEEVRRAAERQQGEGEKGRNERLLPLFSFRCQRRS